MAAFRVEVEIIVRAPAESYADYDARQRIFDRIMANLPERIHVTVEEATIQGGRYQVRIIVEANVTATSYSVVENAVQTRLNNLLGSDRLSHTIKRIELVS